MNPSPPTQCTLTPLVSIALLLLFNLLLSTVAWAQPSKSDRLSLQNQIDKYEYLDQGFLPWAHNAYNSTAHGAIGHFRNQDISVTAQLNAGQRLIDLDPQYHYSPGIWWLGFVRLCHNFCLGTEQLLSERIQDIKNWFDADPWRYENEVVVLFLETYNHNMLSLLGYKYPQAVDDITNIMGDLIYKPDYRCHAFEELASDFTKADILAAGKNIVLFGSGDDNQGQYASCSGFYGDWGDWVFTLDYTGGAIVDYIHFDGYPDCSGPGFPGQSGFSSTYNDFATGGGGGLHITVSEIEELMGCGVNAVSVEPFNPENSEHEALIWSWQENEPDAGPTSNESCARHTQHGLEDADCSASARYACQHMDDGHWEVTDGSGPWEDGPQACHEEFGTEYAFSVPANGYQSNRIQSAKASSGDSVFLNYSDLETHGDWQPLELATETTFEFLNTIDGEMHRKSPVPMKFLGGLPMYTYGHDGSPQSAIEFGPNGNLRYGNEWRQKFGSNFTISVWFKTGLSASPNTDRYLVHFSESGFPNSGSGILMQPNGELQAWCRDESNHTTRGLLTTSTTHGYMDGQWHQALYVHSDNGAILYVDGEAMDYTADTCADVTDARQLEIGTFDQNAFPGALDDVGIYGYALTMPDESARIRARQNSNACIQKQNSGWSNGNTTVLWDCDDRANEYKAWIYESSTGYIRSGVNPTKCLHKRDSNWNKGNPIVVEDCAAGNSSDKSWDYNSSTGRISGRHNSSMCFHKKWSNDWNNGNPIHLWSCSGGPTANKSWDLD